jgi:endonuclease/exonuclease/phosphatase family metal-dependent hydrolase
MKYLLILSVLVSGCVSATKKVATVEPEKIKVMTMNVENLFDLEDNPEKNDEAFLPASLKANPAMQNRCRAQNNTAYRAEECIEKDWSREILERKFARLTDVLEQVNGGLGPDILILQEVENRKVLELWRDGYLKKMNYQTISWIEGPDDRGIDTAVMSRLPMVGTEKLHLMDYSTTPQLQAEPQRPTRGILETLLQLPSGDKLAVFAVHFPSQGASTIHRKAAVDTLLKLTSQVPAGTSVVVGGDFNITSTEDFKEKYFTKSIQPKLSVSHIVGCGECVGTSFWFKDRTWSFFDVLLFSKDLDGGDSPWQLDRDSIHIVKTSKYQWNQYGSPASFRDGRGSTGVTDHLPVYAELKLKKDKKVTQ